MEEELEEALPKKKVTKKTLVATSISKHVDQEALQMLTEVSLLGS